MREPNSFWQVLFFELKPDSIVAGISHISQPIGHSKCEENSSVCPGRDAGVTLLDLAESHPADRRPLRQDCDWNAPPPPRVADIVAQLPERTSHRYRSP